MYAGCKSLIIFFSRFRLTLRPRYKLIGPISAISNAAVNSCFTQPITPKLLAPMILISSTKVLTIKPFILAVDTNILWFALIH